MVDVHQTRRVQPVASCASRSGNPKAMVLLLSVLTVFRVQGREHPDDMCRKIPMQCSSSHRLLLDCPEVGFWEIWPDLEHKTPMGPANPHGRVVGVPSL